MRKDDDHSYYNYRVTDSSSLGFGGTIATSSTELYFYLDIPPGWRLYKIRVYTRYTRSMTLYRRGKNSGSASAIRSGNTNTEHNLASTSYNYLKGLKEIKAKKQRKEKQAREEELEEGNGDR